MAHAKRSDGPATVRGLVEFKHVSRGSKSERDACVLVADDGEELFLRRRQGHPYADDVLKALAGKRIETTGTVIDRLFLMDEWTELKD
jgi:hypothetical protein